MIDALIWQLDWGDSFDKIVAAAQGAGVPIDALPCVATKVDLFGHLYFEWSAFHSLSTDRQVGMGLGPIPWSSIDRFADRYRLISDEFDRFCRMIQAMDIAFLAYQRKSSDDAKR